MIGVILIKLHRVPEGSDRAAQGVVPAHGFHAEPAVQPIVKEAAQVVARRLESEASHMSIEVGQSK